MTLMSYIRVWFISSSAPPGQGNSLKIFLKELNHLAQSDKGRREGWGGMNDNIFCRKTNSGLNETENVCGKRVEAEGGHVFLLSQGATVRRETQTD